MRVRISPAARGDIRSIFAYWAERAGLQVADKIVDGIVERFSMPQQFPRIGRKCDDLASGVRSIAAGDYLIYYRKLRGRIEIVRVFHGSRDQTRAWRSE